MKKIMLLGGNYVQMTAIKAAKELGHYVITVDYLPDNPGHKLADEYHNVSTVDKEAVLELAQKLNIDGIVSYASDVSAPTAAYVAEKMGLPTNPYESVMILTRKDLFRPFLEKHGFNSPKSRGFSDYEAAFKFFNDLNKAVIIKPSDANGSKGVIQIEQDGDFKSAFEYAMNYTRQKIVIVEEFIKRCGHQLDGDGFILDGKLVFTGLMNQHCHKQCNPFVPAGLSYPPNISEETNKKITEEINRILKFLNMKFGAINIEVIFDSSDNFYIVEIGPRNGGNMITDVIKAASGVDLAKCTIQAALGLEIDEDFTKPIHSYVSYYNAHAASDGIYVDTHISEEIKNDIILFDNFMSPGDKVKRFDNGALATGAVLLKHKNMDEMIYRMDNMEKFITVKVK